MGDHEVLFDVLRRFARTMSQPYVLIDVLHELCDHATEVLGATGAGVSVFDEDGELRFVTGTSEPVIAAEQAQERTQSGPCYAAIDERRPIAVEDIRADRDRWPSYGEVLRSNDLRAVLGLPLVLDDQRIGALDVYDRASRVWRDTEITAASVLADVATAYIANASELARTRRTAEQLQTALDSRIVIEQAKGKISESSEMSMDDAFEAIRRHARTNGRTVRSVAQQVIDDGTDAIL